MKTKKHPIVGLMVKGYMFEQFALARVVSAVTTHKKLTGLIVRTHCPDASRELVDGMSSWDRAQVLYVGRKVEIPLSAARMVWPGPEEAWVDLTDFLDWCSPHEETTE